MAVAAPVRTLPRSAAGLLVGLFVAAAFAGSTLVFLVEPMTAQLVLPVFGGASSVWITALVFFQAVLLVGYGYAHLSTRLLGRHQPVVHAGVLLAPLLALPIALPANASPVGHGSPAAWLLLVLLVCVGAPFFAVTTASPTLQRWFSETRHDSASDPYFLYAAGNAGSLLALLVYPLLIQPRLTLSEQTHLWAVLYVAFVALCMLCAVIARRARPDQARRVVATSAPLTWRQRVRWVVLAFIPSSLLVGSTTHMTTDIAPIPLLWVVPLAVYLLTFIFAFSARPPVTARAAGRVLPLVVVAAALAEPWMFSVPLWLTLIIQPALLFFAAMLAHGTLAGERPPTDRLTEFYFLLALGGVLGSSFNAFLAPKLFSSLIEYPLVIGVALLLRDEARRSAKARQFQILRDIAIGTASMVTVVLLAFMVGAPTKAVLATAVIGSLLFYAKPVRFAFAVGLLLVLMSARGGLYVERDFYGQLIVREGADHLHVLNSGTTLHGLQWFDHRRVEPLGYYTRSGPIGQVFDKLQRRRPFHDVGVVGLGVGTLAAFGRSGQHLTFIEIDPADVAIAQNARWFTFLRDTKATVNVIVGDGRLELDGIPDDSYDLLTLDAFSSDSIPVHLITREAIALEMRKVRPGGALAFHISNHFLELEPVFAAAARDLDFAGVAQDDTHVTAAQKEAGKVASHWVVLARHADDIAPLLGDPRWHRLARTSDRAWTDDYSNVVGAIDWRMSRR
jgi:hypothetical protein